MDVGFFLLLIFIINILNILWNILIICWILRGCNSLHKKVSRNSFGMMRFIGMNIVQLWRNEKTAIFRQFFDISRRIRQLAFFGHISALLMLEQLCFDHFICYLPLKIYQENRFLSFYVSIYSWVNQSQKEKLFYLCIKFVLRQ